MKKNVGISLVVTGKGAMILGTILTILAAGVAYIIMVKLLHLIPFFICFMALLLFVYIWNMRISYKDMKQMEAEENKKTDIQIYKYNDFKN